MRFALLILVACSFEAGDYSSPAAGFSGVAVVEQCRQVIDLPCGWVYDCGDPAVELCLPWPDRAEIPKLKESAESIYGDCVLSNHPRFKGTPLCKYECPAINAGCNAENGCFCLEESP
jgi:hypothetical protein